MDDCQKTKRELEARKPTAVVRQQKASHAMELIEQSIKAINGGDLESFYTLQGQLTEFLIELDEDEFPELWDHVQCGIRFVDHMNDVL